jgi:O-antigen/teichoic acid export membrane protein
MVMGIYVFSPIIMDWWLGPDGAWYRPYIMWAGIIFVSYWLNRQRGEHEL